jgi:hypothetical protein
VQSPSEQWATDGWRRYWFHRVARAILWEITMRKIAVFGVVALLTTASSFAYAQTSSPADQDHTGAANAADTGPGNLTDARVEVIKAALQLTPDQEKYWPAVEDAIRTRAKNRMARISERMNRLQDNASGEVQQNRNPIDFMHRRADALEQRATDLKKLADAWQPLYQTLSPDQKRRMAVLTAFAVRGVSDRIQQRRNGDSEDQNDEQ